MEDIMDLPIPLPVLLAIIVVIKGLIDGLVRPMVEKFSWSSNVLRLGAWALGVVLVVLAEVLPEHTFLLVITALVVGCGSNVLQEFLSGLSKK
jgi:uncharacterized membrane protein